MKDPQIPVSTLKEKSPLQASKWISSQMLVEAAEMEGLFAELQDFYIYSVGTITANGEEIISKDEFLKHYREYVDTLKKGALPDEAKFRKIFSSVLTVTPEVLFAVPIEPGKQLVRIEKPVIQVQAHRMDYSKADGKFRSMTFGADSITWGLQFSYPQLYQDGKTKEIMQVDAAFLNTPLFRKLQLWARNSTIPTSFLAEGKKITIPVRLGKQCISWINNHPQLHKKGLQVVI